MEMATVANCWDLSDRLPHSGSCLVLHTPEHQELPAEPNATAHPLPAWGGVVAAQPVTIEEVTREREKEREKISSEPGHELIPGRACTSQTQASLELNFRG